MDGAKLRVVGINNPAAASEGYIAETVQVANLGRSVSVSGGNVTITGSTITPITVSTVAAGGTVTQILLECLGRTVGQINGASGTINLDPTQLAYEANTVTPVAIFNDGMQVAGVPITVTRNPVYLSGQAVTPVAQQVAGIEGDYFSGQGGASIAASTFNGTPTAVATYGTLNLCSTTSTTGLDKSPTAMPPANINQLSARFTADFNVTTAGQYDFFFWRTCDSAQLFIDGTQVLAFDNQTYGDTNTNPGTVYLARPAQYRGPHQQPHQWRQFDLLRRVDGVSRSQRRHPGGEQQQFLRDSPVGDGNPQ